MGSGGGGNQLSHRINLTKLFRSNIQTVVNRVIIDLILKAIRNHGSVVIIGRG